LENKNTEAGFIVLFGSGPALSFSSLPFSNPFSLSFFLFKRNIHQSINWLALLGLLADPTNHEASVPLSCATA